jgi:uncharacterized protein (DUF1778 family)
MREQMTHTSEMATATKARKTESVSARLSPEDKALLERAASIEGRSVEAFVISHVRSAAERVLEGRDTVYLTEAESRRFVEALLAPPRPPTERMKAALERYRETVIER